MPALLDVNVLVALIDATHVFHAAVLAWLSANPDEVWASCPLTENGCLRILVNPHYTNPHVPADVLSKLEETKRRGQHAFWPDDLSITNAAVFNWDKLRGRQQVTDVYLLALAFVHGGRFVTFDRRIRLDVVSGSGPEHLEIL